jgi:hypothetical protein
MPVGNRDFTEYTGIKGSEVSRMLASHQAANNRLAA